VKKRIKDGAFKEKTTSYKKLDKVLLNDFIIPKFIPILDSFAPEVPLFGKRVVEIIENDLVMVPLLLNGSEMPLIKNNSAVVKELIHLSSSYVTKLEDIEAHILDTTF